MKYLLILTVIIFGFLSNISAQVFQVLWEKTYGGSQDDYCEYSTLSADSCIYAVGYTTSSDGDLHGNHGGFDVCVMKLSLDGDTLWTRLLGGTLDDKGFYIESTEDNGCIISAATYSTYGQIIINYGGYDYWIVKLDANGNIQWEKTYGGSEDEYAKTIKCTSNNGYIINGWTNSNNVFVHGLHDIFEDMWVLKINNTGDTLWTKCFGGTKVDHGSDITELSDGKYIAIGDTKSDDGDVIGNYASGYLNSWLVKLDTTGNIIWSKCVSDDGMDRVPYSVVATQNDCNGCFVLLENKYLPDYSHALGIYKYNSNGDTIWTKNIKTNFSPNTYPQSGPSSRLIQTLDTNLLLETSISFYNDSIPNIYIEKFNLTTGDSLWAIYLGEPKCFPTSVFEISDNTFIVSGSKINTTDDFYFLKFKVLPVGTETANLKKVNYTVFPNPSTSGQFTIKLPVNHEQLYIIISDNQGKILLIDKINQDQSQYYYSGKLPKGTYILSLSNQNTLSSKRLIVQ